jgi:CRP-like cAMP-binding protein
MTVALQSSNLFPASIRRQFSLRSPLPLNQDCLWQIEAGIVRSLTWLEDGTVIALGLWGPGDVVGRSLSSVEPYQLECLTLVKAISCSLKDWQNPEEILLSHIQQSEELLVIRSSKRMDLMLVKLLHWLAKRFGRNVDQGQLIDLRLTHQDIAELLASTRVTVTRVLSQFEQQGVIERLPMHRIVLKEEESWHYEI